MQHWFVYVSFPARTISRCLHFFLYTLRKNACPGIEEVCVCLSVPLGKLRRVF